MTALSSVYVFSLAVLVVVTIGLVLWNGYHETVTQGVSLALMNFGAFSEIHAVVTVSDHRPGFWPLIVGALLLTLATYHRYRPRIFGTTQIKDPS